MLPVIIMTAHSISRCRRERPSTKQGAFDYLPKPFDIDGAVALVERAISHYQEQQQPRNIEVNGPTTDMIGAKRPPCRMFYYWSVAFFRLAC